MKKLLLFLSLLLSLQAYTLTVKVDNLKNNKGDVIYSIYNNKNNFPDKDFTKYYKQKVSKIVNTKSQLTFNLKKGRYLVSILHDENKNGKIDKGFMLPIEGVGISNYKTINLFHRPDFENGSFILDKNKTIKITIHYF